MSISFSYFFAQKTTLSHIFCTKDILLLEFSAKESTFLHIFYSKVLLSPLFSAKYSPGTQEVLRQEPGVEPSDRAVRLGHQCPLLEMITN